MVEYGRRSMGDQPRCTSDGPRELGEDDFRDDTKRPKVIRNPRENRITAPARFEASVDPERHRRLLAIFDKRAGTQRGKPRSRDPNRNPLGSRIFDMNCGWLLYRQPYSKTFRYLCGLYQQSHGAQCSSNHVDGRTATRFMLSCVRQRALSPQRLQKLERRIQQLAAADQYESQVEQEIVQKRATLREVEAERDQAKLNLARAKTGEQYQAVAGVFDQLCERAKSLESEITTADRQLNPAADADSAVGAAMEIIRQLTELAANGRDLGAARQIFAMLNAQLFLSFSPVKVKKRTLNKVSGGVVTFGDAPPPIEVYQGPTGRRQILTVTDCEDGDWS